MTLLSQRDPRWANIKVGTGDQTIAQIGCTITCLAMILDTTPDVVNQWLTNLPQDANGNTGYANGNLVYWKRISEAFPGISGNRVWTYNNDDILAHVPNLIVQVDGTPIGGSTHFVVYIGNHQLNDPWDGATKPTATYTPTQGYATISGSWTDRPKSLNTYGLDDTNLVSKQIVYDTWNKVVQGEFVAKSEYDRLQLQYNELNNKYLTLQDQFKTGEQTSSPVSATHQSILHQIGDLLKQL